MFRAHTCGLSFCSQAMRQFAKAWAVEGSILCFQLTMVNMSEHRLFQSATCLQHRVYRQHVTAHLDLQI